MDKIKYKIILNNDVNNKKCKVYTYEYGKTKNICIRIEKQSVEIVFDFTRNLEVEEFISFKNKIFYDAYRKIYILHAIIFNEGLVIKNIRILKNNKKEKIKKDNYFPYMFSMIPNKNLELDNEWKRLDSYVIHTTKTEYDKDLRFVALNSYLLSKSKEKEIDKFTNLWTAMNANYNYIASLFEKKLIEKYDFDRLSNNDKGKLKLCHQDAKSIGALAWTIDEHYNKLSRNEKNGLWSEETNFDSEILWIFEKNENIKKFYNDILSIKYDDNNEKYKNIIEYSKKFSVIPYVFWLLLYPYNWRCDYIHGNVSQPLICAYNDDEMYLLKIFNYFLDKFLNEKIPKMFDDNFFNDEIYNKIYNYIVYINTDNTNDFVDRLNRCVRDNINI